MLNTSVLVPLQLERAREDANLVDYSQRTARGSVYLYCTGPAATGPPTSATLDYIAQCLEPSASGMPRADILPLLPYLGWSVERVAQQLTDVEEIVAPAEHASECHALVDCLNQARQGAGLPSVSLTLTAAHAAQGPPAVQQQQQGDVSQVSGTHCSDTQQQQQQQQQCTESTAQGGETGSQVIGDWASPILQFEKVAVGGTFDRLHAGHRLLLAATAIVAKERIFVGITADQLLASKANRELLQSYEEREAAAVRYMRLVNPRASVVAGPLTDPKEPPLCAVDPEFDAIVVSQETLPGAIAINQTRAKQGFAPLVIVVVGIIHSRHRNAKLSSTDLREEDAAERANLQHQQS